MANRLDFAPLLLPAPAAAHFLGVSETKLRNLPIRRKVLDGKRLYDRRDLEDYANGLAYEGEAEGGKRGSMRQGIGMRLKGIKVVVKPDGTRYVYRRVGPKLVRLPDLPENDPGFILAWHAAGEVDVRPKPKAGTVEALADAYQASDEWKALARNTRMMRARIIKKIVADRSTAPVAGLLARHIEADLKGLSPIVANDRRKVWMALCTFAMSDDRFTLAENPARATPRRKVKSDGHRPWPEAHREAFREHWGYETPQRLAFEIFSWTGARCCDARLLGRQFVDGSGWLCFTQQKTAVPVSIPFSCETLPDWCSDLAAEHAHLRAVLAAHRGSLTYIVTAFGSPRSEKGISQWFGEMARDAGVPMGFAAHGLRKNCGMRLAEIGGTTHQIMSWLGHLSLDESAAYTKAANRRRVLEGGTERNRNRGNSGEPVSKTAEKSW